MLKNKFIIWGKKAKRFKICKTSVLENREIKEHYFVLHSAKEHSSRTFFLAHTHTHINTPARIIISIFLILHYTTPHHTHIHQASVRSQPILSHVRTHAHALLFQMVFIFDSIFSCIKLNTEHQIKKIYSEKQHSLF